MTRAFLPFQSASASGILDIPVIECFSLGSSGVTAVHPELLLSSLFTLEKIFFKILPLFLPRFSFFPFLNVHEIYNCAIHSLSITKRIFFFILRLLFYINYLSRNNKSVKESEVEAKRKFYYIYISCDQITERFINRIFGFVKILNSL